jgi:radical SAM superfamily enzyme YgiQ (UPF0313 family)/ubiquinone/menaquinone biosynthesis C-methylase UbiE
MASSIYLINPAPGMATYFSAEVLAANGSPRLAYFAELVIATVAAFVPKDWNITLCDENIDTVDFDSEADFIGITGKISQFGRMQEIAAEFRRRGKTVLIGGPYASLVPDKVRPHCDILVRGEIEAIAPQLFADLERGQWQTEYLGGQPDLRDSPTPRWDLYPNERAFAGVVQTSRGCPYRCEYCDVIIYAGRKQRHKTPQQVMRELDVLYALGYRSIFLADDNLTANRRQARELLSALRDWNQRQTQGSVAFSTQLSIEVANYPEVLQLCAEAGLCIAYIGIETPNQAALKASKKSQNLRGDLLEHIHTLQAYGIRVIAGAIIGFDEDGADSFEHYYDFAQRSGIGIFSLGALVAPEATPLYERLQAAGRLRENEAQTAALVPWETNVIHASLSAAELSQGRRWLANRLYSPDAMTERLLLFIDTFVPHRYGEADDAAPIRPITRHAQALLARLPTLGFGEQRMMRRLTQALANKPAAAQAVYDDLLTYMQVRYVYESAHFWEPALGAMLSPQGLQTVNPERDYSALFEAGYLGYGKDSTLLAIFRRVYQAEYPQTAKPYSYISNTELRWMAESFTQHGGQTLVDIGCGHGGPGLWLAREIGANLVGIDSTASAIAIAQQRISEFSLTGQARFLLGDFCHTGLDSLGYDGAISIDALVFVADKSAALSEVNRILKKQALFIFTTWEFPASTTWENHQTLLEKTGFEVLRYIEPDGWKQRQRQVYEGILAAKETLIQEMTETVAQAWITDALSGLRDIEQARRIFVVARKKHDARRAS